MSQPLTIYGVAMSYALMGGNSGRGLGKFRGGGALDVTCFSVGGHIHLNSCANKSPEGPIFTAGDPL
jgi:hypothetical protein